MARVGIVMGSASDKPAMLAARDVLSEFNIESEVRIMSAHRTPDAVHAWVAAAPERGVQVLICGAGMSAHLAGVVAATSQLPVIGVPLGAGGSGSVADGLDALMSTVQMPPGVPVASVAVGKAGAKNAAHLAVRIMALSDPDLARRLTQYRKDMAADVLAADAALQAELNG